MGTWCSFLIELALVKPYALILTSFTTVRSEGKTLVESTKSWNFASVKACLFSRVRRISGPFATTSKILQIVARSFTEPGEPTLHQYRNKYGDGSYLAERPLAIRILVPRSL